MASGVELATAYVTLTASTKGLGKQVSQSVNGPEMSKAGRSAGSRIGGALGGVLKKSALGAGAAVAGILGTSLVKGFKRLNSIDQATAKLKGLGNSAKSVDKIMGNALSSVKGTAFGLGDAATVAASAVAAGVKPGKQLAGVLKTVANTAAASGSSLTDMGSIFNKVKTSNKAYNGSLQQLADRGVPIYQALAKQLGVSAGAVSKLASKGKISFAQFSKAAKTASGKVALSMGDTVKGSFANLGASLGRIGANLQEGVFSKLTPLFKGITTALGPIEDKAKGVGTALGKYIGRAADSIRSAWPKIKSTALSVFGYIKDQLLPAVSKGFGQLKDAAAPLWPALKEIGKALLPLFKGATGSAKSSGPGVLAGAFDLLRLATKGIAKAVSGIADFATKHGDAFRALAVGLVTAAAGIKALLIAQKAAKAFSALNLAMAANPIGLVIVGLVALAAGLVYAYKHSETFRNIVNKVFGAVKKVALDVLHWFTRSFIPFFTKSIPSAFRSTMDWIQRNWAHVKDFITWPLRQGMKNAQTALSAIQRAFHATVSWVSTTFRSGWAKVEQFVTWPLRQGLKNARSLWGFIQRAFSSASSWVGSTFRRSWSAITGIITAPVKLARSALGTVLSTVEQHFRNAVDTIGRIWSRLEGLAKRPIKFIVDTVLNKGLIWAFNKIASILPGVGSIPRISLPNGFRDGGYTGNAPKNRPVGVVHGDEHVIKATSRRRIEAQQPGYLDYLNNYGRIPGYLRGGRVDEGAGRLVNFEGGTFTPNFADHIKLAQKIAGYAFQIFQGGWRPPTSYSGTSHRGDALDVGPVNATTVRALRAVGIAAWDRTGMGNWMPHVHGVPLPGSGTALGSAVWQAQDYLRGGNGLGGKDNGAGSGNHGGILGGIKHILDKIGHAFGGFASPGKWLGSLAKGAMGKMGSLGSSPFAQLVKAVPKKLLGGMISKVEGAFGLGGGGGGSAPSGSNQSIGHSLMLAAGFPESQWGSLQKLWTGESGWRTNAKNPSSGAYGIPQAWPAKKMASAGSDWLTNPATQEKWGLGYIKGAYGNPANAYSKWLSRSPHWYAGGTPAAKAGLAWVGESGPELVNFKGGERVYSSSQSKAAMDGTGLTAGGTTIINVQDASVRKQVQRALDHRDMMLRVAAGGPALV